MKKLLVVDDSSVVRAIVVRVLREAGLGDDGIVEASSGAEALCWAGRDSSIGLVLADRRMPGMDGLAFVRALRERRTREELPVLVLSSDTTAAFEGEVRAAGANGWLAKPFDAAEARAAVAPWLARSDR